MSDNSNSGNDNGAPISLGITAATSVNGSDVCLRLEPVVARWCELAGVGSTVQLTSSLDVGSRVIPLDNATAVAHLRSIDPSIRFWTVAVTSESPAPDSLICVVDATQTATIDRATLLHLRLPPRVEHRTVRELFQLLVSTLEPTSATAGFTVATPLGDLGEHFTQAYVLARRYWGADLFAAVPRSWDSRVGLASVNWLNYVSNDLLSTCDASNLVDAEHHGSVLVSRTANGLFAFAGEQPCLGDMNRGEFPAAYTAAAEFFEPVLVAEPSELPGVFGIMQTTRRWQRRFTEPQAWLEADPT